MTGLKGYLLLVLFLIFVVVFFVRAVMIFINHRSNMKYREVISNEPPIFILNSKVALHQPWGYMPMKGGDNGELEITVREHHLQVSLPPRYYGKVPGAEYYIDTKGMTLDADKLSIVVTGNDRNKTRKLLIRSGIHTNELLNVLNTVVRSK